MIDNRIERGIRASFSAPEAKTAKDAVAPKSDKTPLKRCFRGVFHAFSEDFAKHPKAVFRHLGIPKVSPPVRYEPKMGHFEKKGGTLRLFFKLVFNDLPNLNDR